MKADANPNTIVYFNNQYVALKDAKISILTHALHYGAGVFDGIRGYWDEAQQDLFVMRPVEHYARWKKNCGILRIDVPRTDQALCEITLELIRRNGFKQNIYVRPIAYKSAERIGVYPDDQDAFSVIALPFGDYLPSEKGLHACITSWRRVEDNAIPGRAKICGAYVNSVLATDEARRNGFDEAIFLSESGHVAEGATCNIFMLRGGKLITPSASENILEGITRDTILELARREMGLEVVERPIDRTELYICDELFFTGTAVELGPIVRVDHRAVGAGVVGEVTGRLRALYRDATRGRLPQYKRWLVPAYHPTIAGRAA
ncbi:MAG: branched-chain amino acid transaminase [Bryobacteraceae bacterium]